MALYLFLANGDGDAVNALFQWWYYILLMAMEMMWEIDIFRYQEINITENQITECFMHAFHPVMRTQL